MSSITSGAAAGSTDWATLLLSPKGRVSRKTFWLKYLLVLMIVLVVAMLIDWVLGLKIGETDDFPGIGVLTLVWIPLAAYSGVCVQIKRWHDIDKSGWWILINLVPVIGGPWAFISNGFIRS